jgi:propionyl-CoA carboxylase alpha chain
MTEDYIKVIVETNYLTKIITSNINLFKDGMIKFPSKIDYKIKYINPSIELNYRGMTLNAFVIPKHVSSLSKYMKPIKLIDKSNLLICPMPGKLIKIMVNEQDSVEEGQSLCVVEAMKMENTLVAQKQGRIKAIKFNEGDTLSVDQVIMEFEFNK